VARAVNRTWYRIALAPPDGKPPVLVAAEGEHAGVAIAAAEQHVKGSYAIAVERASDDHIPLGESVGKQTVVSLPDDISTTPTFHWPRGVLPQLGEHANVRRGFTVHADPALLVVEAQTEAPHIQDLFLGVLERLPSADNLEVRVLDHFENGTTDVWLTSRVDGRKIIDFLDENDVELIENGHVELSVYIRAHKATLRLTEHKTVVWLSDGEGLRTDVLSWFTELGVPQIEPFASITSVPHIHWRPAKSRERRKLAEHLYRQRLRRVDKLVAPARDTDG
jgi:hypothetical protein